ncbi:MAG: protein O-mannosyl-transferase TMTC1-related protein [Planctomycetota bacterium]
MTARSISRGLALAVLAAAIVPYANTLGHGFAVDDAFIAQSPLLHRPWDVGAVFSNGFYKPEDRVLGIYRPLANASVLLNAALARAIFGDALNPVPFHAVNLLLHAGASLLLLLWLLRLGIARFAAGACALLWAVHPIHAEVVSNVTVRSESLAAVFGLGFLILHRAGRNWLGALCFFGALCSKEPAVSFLPLAAIADRLWPPSVSSSRTLRAFGLPAVILVAWLVLRGSILAGEPFVPPAVENPLVTAPVLPRVLTAAKVQLLYLRDHFFPFHLSTDWSFDQIPLVTGAVDPAVLAFAVILAGAVAAGVFFRRRQPEVGFAVLGYACAFAPTSNFLLPIGTIMADRLAYVPSIFPCLLAATMLACLRQRWHAAAGALSALPIVALGLLAFRANRSWKDELTLFREQVRTAPRSAKSHGNLGVALLNRGQFHEAIAEFRESIRIYPRRPPPYIGMANALDAIGADPELSIQAWSDALRYVPLDATPALRRALRLVDLGRWAELAEQCRETTATDPEAKHLPSLERILVAADRLRAAPPAPTAWETGADKLLLGDPGAAVLAVARAIHQGAVPRDRIADALAIQMAAYERMGNVSRASELRAAAAEAD